MRTLSRTFVVCGLAIKYYFDILDLVVVARALKIINAIPSAVAANFDSYPVEAFELYRSY
jgi:hypothetical protein